MKKLILLFSLFGLAAFGALTDIPTYVETNTELHTADGFYLIDSKMPESLWALIINRNMEQLEWLTPDRTNGVMTQLTVNDWLQINGVMTNAAPVAMEDTLDVTGDTALAANLTVVSNATVTGATSLGSTLGVTGATSLSNMLVVTGATTLSDVLTVTGDTTLSADLNVTSNVTIIGTLEVTGTLEATATIDANAGITAGGVQSTFGVNGLSSSGRIAANGGLTVSNGKSTVLNGTLTVDDDKTTMGGDLEVDGVTTINSNLNVSGTSTLTTVAIDGGAIDSTVIGSNTPVAGAFTTLTASSIDGDLNGNAATATTATNLSGGSVTATSGTFSGDLSVGGNVGLCNDPTNELSFFGGSGATAKTVNLPSEYVTNNLVYIITTNTTAELDALRVKCASLETQVQETRAKLRELISDLGAYNLIN